MADSAWTPHLVSAICAAKEIPRHPAVVRVTHWVTTLCFFALLLSGLEIVVSHPRFYWGEAGNSLSKPLFQIPIPASRPWVPTGYNYTLPDQNGWSRSLHFQTAWVIVIAGLLYVVYGMASGHFRKRLLPAGSDLSWRVLGDTAWQHVRRVKPAAEYNVLQQIAYLGVIFVLLPLMIWTGLAMSPGFVSAFPFTVTALGGQQSARTIHFLVTGMLVLFVVAHVAMVWLAGFKVRVRAMLTGRGE
jgi:thiosulfate reductase cytochrome b subunit